MWGDWVCCRGNSAVAVAEPQSSLAAEVPVRSYSGAHVSTAAVAEQSEVAPLPGSARSSRGSRGSSFSSGSRLSDAGKGKMKVGVPPASPVISGCNVPINMRPSSSGTASTSAVTEPSLSMPETISELGDATFVGVHAAYVPLDPTDPDSFLVPTWSLRCMTDRQKARNKQSRNKKKLPKLSLNPEAARMERERAHLRVLQEQKLLLELHGSPLNRTSDRPNTSPGMGMRNLQKVSALDKRTASGSERDMMGGAPVSEREIENCSGCGSASTFDNAPSSSTRAPILGARIQLAKEDSARQHQDTDGETKLEPPSGTIQQHMIYPIG
mmetsp:Transcript_162/g.434  ORF Transcript_162/g.434 Transcript_162/m.434 type:complete len:326 (+) Transcript_162:611-1588(+)